MKKSAFTALEARCPQCGKSVTQNPKRKKKRFCSDECRYIWWGFNRDAMNNIMQRKIQG